METTAPPNLELSYTPAQLKLFFENETVKFKICTKGRRFGATEGAEKAFIEWALQGITPMLWVDTINGNIDRYFDRYFYPDLKKLPEFVKWNFNSQKRLLKIHNSIIDFRSADAPESIEGFGYKKIFMNEAGIILKDDYLYSNSILPMLLDYPDSQLIAAGVPKGKHKKNGEKHKFFELYENAKANKAGYVLYEFTSYDNPLLDHAEIDKMINEMSEAESQQEIYGKFVENSGENPFAHQYIPAKHESARAIFDESKQLVIEMDFNLNPMAVTFSHIWQDARGLHDHQFDEMEIKNASLPEAVERIRSKYYNVLQGAVLGGDYSGMRGSLEHRQNWSVYKQILQGLGMSEHQLKIVPNPTHVKSRADVNFVLSHHPDFIINPETCQNTCRDMRNVQCDAHGQILKRDRSDVNQRADFIDTVRSKVAFFHRAFIDKK
ncbi:MAG: hypothetical protein ACEQSL_01570 [Sediminibacterium sp.]